MLEISQEDIAAIVSLVFTTTLDVEVEAAEGPPPSGGEVASSLVGITGNWDGAVIVACERALAVRFARAMFGISDEEVGESDINDALGELVNMIGGNLKSMLPPPCHLSLPTVVAGREYRVRLPGAKVVRELDFAANGARLRIAIAERAAA